MHLEQWRAVQTTEPATMNQAGKIHREFGRLGSGEDDRSERLAICARMPDLVGLRSLRDLTMGEAGRLINALPRVRDRAQLIQALPGPGGSAAPYRPLPQTVIAALAAGYPSILITPAPRAARSHTGGRTEQSAADDDAA